MVLKSGIDAEEHKRILTIVTAKNCTLTGNLIKPTKDFFFNPPFVKVLPVKPFNANSFFANLFLSLFSALFWMHSPNQTKLKIRLTLTVPGTESPEFENCCLQQNEST